MSEYTSDERLQVLERKIDAIYETTEKTRKYFMWTLWITLALVVLPSIGLLFAVPNFIATYNETMLNLDLEGL